MTQAHTTIQQLNSDKSNVEMEIITLRKDMERMKMEKENIIQQQQHTTIQVDDMHKQNQLLGQQLQQARQVEQQVWAAQCLISLFDAMPLSCHVQYCNVISCYAAS